MFELDLGLSSYVCVLVERGSDSVSEIHCHFCARLRGVAALHRGDGGVQNGSACAEWVENVCNNDRRTLDFNSSGGLSVMIVPQRFWSCRYGGRWWI